MLQVDSTSTDHHAGDDLLCSRLSPTALHRSLPTQRREVLAVAQPRDTARRDLLLEEGNGYGSDVELRGQLRSVLRQRVGVQARRSGDVPKTSDATAVWRPSPVSAGNHNDRADDSQH